MGAIGMTRDEVCLEKPVYRLLSSSPTVAEAAGHIHYLKSRW